MQNGALYDGRSPFDLSAATATPGPAAAPPAAAASVLQAAAVPRASAASPIATAPTASRHVIPATATATASPPAIATDAAGASADEPAAPVGAPLSPEPPEGLAREEWRREVHVPGRNAGLADDGLRGEHLPPADRRRWH